MEAGNLLAVCGTAFLAVFVLLGALAAIMHAITVVFAPRPAAAVKAPAVSAEAPPGAEAANAALIAAVASSLAVLYPRMRVTKIEEEL